MAVLLEMKDIHKIYPNGTVANKGVDLQVNEGEIHALVGENGAGKSTLMKILFGLEAPTSGTIEYKGQKIQFNGPRDAIGQGMGMVHQHFMLAPSLTVSENIVLGDEPRKGLFSMFRDRKKELDDINELIRKFGLKLDPQAVVEAISVGQKQRVEILKVLYRGAKLIILDEPTAVLTPQETDELFDSIKSLVAQGYTIIFITHKLREVMEISDRITVLRAGKTIATLVTKDTNQEEISRLMVGRDVLFRVQKNEPDLKDVVLEIDRLSALDDKGSPALKEVSFSVRGGEVFGIAGVEGNGQTELIEVITGLRNATGGKVLYFNENIVGKSIGEIRNMKIGHIPEDRQTTGACLTSSIAENIILDVYDNKEFRTGPFMNYKKLREFAKVLMATFDVRAQSPETMAGSLSGGNLQKVVIAREIAKNPKLLIASQPTRGVDIGAIEFIHREIIKKRDQGTAVLLVSAELSEIMSLSDRIGVLYNGELVAILDNTDDLTEQEIGYYMLGIKNQQKEAAVQ
ncbi:MULTISPECIES: ABC transporter ATP-binding protein [unclassified Paenibacillus]|uniref:ABC transporter ATP-binding protein n=1 Tax=unclassified Paenibacillus TaxID=185978 RepID=UPI001C109CA1|nr:MULTISPECIES: ABC transporter ATP-binding protein [unclassified Paenibacillus]MBU5445373.1 ABC transporter ATP-binding protein [Paenibacillus sp. MSJ-34]CAH0122500.1 Galactose/methyl galactoside import ATP-binding protein MglA [Paenibacillus sp. CECT 9249]